MRNVLSIRDITTLSQLKAAIESIECTQEAMESARKRLSLYIDPMALTLIENTLTDGSKVHDVHVVRMND